MLSDGPAHVGVAGPSLAASEVGAPLPQSIDSDFSPIVPVLAGAPTLNFSACAGRQCVFGGGFSLSADPPLAAAVLRALLRWLILHGRVPLMVVLRHPDVGSLRAWRGR